VSKEKRRAKGEGSIVAREYWQLSLAYKDSNGRPKRLRVYAKTKADLKQRIAGKVADNPDLEHRLHRGEGAITKSTRWQYSIDCGKDKSGNRRRTYIYATSRAALIRKISDERARAGGSFRARSRVTIAEWVELWLKKEKQPNLARSTYAVYEVAWRVHVKPLIGSRRLDKLDADDVQNLYDDLRDKKVGGRTVQVAAKIMRAAFDAAINQKKLSGSNPWRTKSIPTHKAREGRVLTPEEAARFIVAARNDAFEGVWLLGLFGGLRLGECLGLRWGDVDLETGEVRVRQQATEVYGHVEIGPLKTASSQRDIVISGTTLDSLRRRRAAADVAGHGSEFVFTTPTGRLLDRNNVRRRHFAEVCKKAEIKGLRPHDLRHSMTSHAIAAGLSPIVVARRLGHGSTRMTLDRYGHQLPGQQREAATALEGRLDPAAGRPVSPK
jgi:integrase